MDIKDKKFLYGSHLPVLSAIYEILSPKKVVEFGSGYNSTPFFSERSDSVISIETEDEWFKIMAEKEDFYDNLKMIYHSIPGVGRKTKNISKSIKKDCLDFYLKVLGEDERDLMFVDHVSGLRAFTIASLYSKFDIIVYHDAQSQGYKYDSLKKIDFSDYYHIVHKTYPVHTGVIIKKKTIGSIDNLISKILEYEINYCGDFGISPVDSKIEIL